VRPGEALVPEEELVRTEYYNDYLLPQNVHYSLGAAYHFNDGVHIHLGAVRSKRAGAFGPDKQKIAEALSPHVGQAISLRVRLERERCRVQALEELADALPFGVLQLNAKGRVLEANRRGAEILQASDGLQTVDGVLSAASWADSRALSLLIAGAAQPAVSVKPGGATRIGRPSGARAYVVNVFPLHAPELFGVGPERPAVMVLISDPAGLPENAIGRLREAFHLTPTEARICLALASGEELTAAAEQLGMTAGTARTHLKHVFSKSETSRQSELVRLLNDAFQFRLGE
jgi:DNA-binding CsgD family transcriptional regulator